MTHRRSRAAVPRWVWPVGLALLALVVVRLVAVQTFAVPSASMAPTIEPGDRLLVNRLDRGELRRGDLVVFDGARVFGSPSDYVKRVIGLPGDRVRCCDEAGRLTVNGAPLDEPYVYPGDAASDVTFDVQVPDGRLWVLGDHRSDSADSRAYLGQPEGGMLSQDDVIGQPWVRYWPLDRLGRVDGAAS